MNNSLLSNIKQQNYLGVVLDSKMDNRQSHLLHTRKGDNHIYLCHLFTASVTLVNKSGIPYKTKLNVMSPLLN